MLASTRHVVTTPVLFDTVRTGRTATKSGSVFEQLKEAHFFGTSRVLIVLLTGPSLMPRTMVRIAGTEMTGVAKDNGVRVASDVELSRTATCAGTPAKLGILLQLRMQESLIVADKELLGGVLANLVKGELFLAPGRDANTSNFKARLFNAL